MRMYEMNLEIEQDDGEDVIALSVYDISQDTRQYIFLGKEQAVLVANKIIELADKIKSDI